MSTSLVGVDEKDSGLEKLDPLIVFISKLTL